MPHQQHNDRRNDASTGLLTWRQFYGPAMYTLGACWLMFFILAGGFGFATDQPKWVYAIQSYGLLIVLWHGILGYEAYREHEWARWWGMVTLALDLGLLIIPTINYFFVEAR